MYIYIGGRALAALLVDGRRSERRSFDGENNNNKNKKNDNNNYNNKNNDNDDKLIIVIVITILIMIISGAPSTAGSRATSA